MDKIRFIITFILVLLIFISLGTLFSNNKEVDTQDYRENYSSIQQPEGKEISNRIEVSCDETYYKTAFVLLETKTNRATNEEIEAVSQIKEKVSKRFYDKTGGLAIMDTSYPVTILEVENGTDIYKYYDAIDVPNLFYKTHPDEFNFLVVYTSYESMGSMHYIPISNYIEGIGKKESGHGIGYNSGYGSNGTLLGIANLRGIDRNIDQEIHKFAVNGILHEIGHQWGVYIDFMNNGESYFHWSSLLNSNKSVMGGKNWKDNQDGTFSIVEDDNFIQGYSDFDLYLMGLLSPEKVEPTFIVVTNNSLTSTIKGYSKEITAQDIIEEYGERRCFTCSSKEMC